MSKQSDSIAIGELVLIAALMVAAFATWALIGMPTGGNKKPACPAGQVCGD